MLKLGLWVGTPSAVTYLASSYSALLENFVLFSLLSVAALLVAVLPRLSERVSSR
jgi:hypothetical protein